MLITACGALSRMESLSERSPRSSTKESVSEVIVYSWAIMIRPTATERPASTG
jgi:hypothetical protein